MNGRRCGDSARFSRPSLAGLALAGGLLSSVAACASRGPDAARISPSVGAAIGGRFHLLVSRDTLVDERYHRSAQRIEGEYLDRVRRTRVSFAAAVASDGSITRLESSTWVRGSTGRADTVRVATFSGDSIRVEENGRLRWVSGAGGAQIVLGPAGAFTEQLLIRARRRSDQNPGGARDTVSLQVFEASERRVRRVTVRWVGRDSASVTVLGERGDVAVYAPSGLLVRLHYRESAGMRLLRAP
jgi:hypothetical protein